MDLIRFGRSIRALRVRRGWRQDDLALAARMSRTQVGRIERGERPGLRLDAVDRVATALGADVELRVRWRGEGLDRLLDAAHARLVDSTIGIVRTAGWHVAVEATFSRYGERGSIDVLAFHPRRRALAVIEVKSVVADMQAMLHGLDRKARLAPSIAAGHGWDADGVGRILVVWATGTNRRRLLGHAATVGAALPAGSRDVRRWLADPVERGFAGVLFVPDAQDAAATGVWRQRVRRPRA